MSGTLIMGGVALTLAFGIPVWAQGSRYLVVGPTEVTIFKEGRIDEATEILKAMIGPPRPRRSEALRLGERLAPLIACRVSRGTEVEVVVGPSKTSEEWKPYHPVRVVSGPGAGCEGEMESAYLGQR